MIMEKFKQACEIMEKINEAIDLSDLLDNYKTTGFSLKLCTQKDNNVVNHVDTIPDELWLKLKETCQNYIKEQQAKFENL